MSTTPAAPAVPQAQLIDGTEDLLLTNYKITNQCECYLCPQCNTVTTGDVYGETCENCDTDATLNPLGYCDGFCREDIDAVHETFATWMENNPSDHGYYVSGEHMGWRHRSGHKIVGTYGEDVDPVAALAVDSEWTQYWSIDPREGGKVRCTQSHHDAPTGESYVIAPRIGCLDECDDFSDWDR